MVPDGGYVGWVVGVFRVARSFRGKGGVLCSRRTERDF